MELDDTPLSRDMVFHDMNHVVTYPSKYPVENKEVFTKFIGFVGDSEDEDDLLGGRKMSEDYFMDGEGDVWVRFPKNKNGI